MSEIKFTMAARCEAAGRPNNEDNFQLTDDLGGELWGFLTDKEGTLSEKGSLMVVCDGMGGMNAGEVASDLAVKTIREWFSADRLTSQVLSSHKAIEQFIREAIITADAKIKEAGQQNSELAGMGSTIVLAWLIGENIYIGWCGDSRAYRYNPAFGLERLSRDHSYVQELVDSGKLSEALAFDHPDGNIITRSLGDPRQLARPDVSSFPLCNSDVILLCSDGLHGVLHDREIEAILADNAGTLENCRNALWTATEKAGWDDNVTIALCRVISGAINVQKAPDVPQMPAVTTESRKRIPAALVIAVVILLIIIAFALGHYVGSDGRWFPHFEIPHILDFFNTEAQRTQSFTEF